jgi:hypothetical protein
MDRYAGQLRIQYFGARYHVMSRGDRREAIFYADADRVEFLRNIRSGLRKSEDVLQLGELSSVALSSSVIRRKAPFFICHTSGKPEMRLMNWLVSTCRLYVARFVSRSRKNE